MLQHGDEAAPEPNPISDEPLPAESLRAVIAEAVQVPDDRHFETMPPETENALLQECDTAARGQRMSGEEPLLAESLSVAIDDAVGAPADGLVDAVCQHTEGVMLQDGDEAAPGSGMSGEEPLAAE